MKVIATRPAWLAWGAVAILLPGLTGVLIWLAYQLLTGQLLGTVGNMDRPGAFGGALIAMMIALPFALIHLIRSIRTLIRHGSAVIWVQNNALCSNYQRPIPLDEIREVEAASFHLTLWLKQSCVRITKHTGEAVMIGVGGMQPSSEVVADIIIGLLRHR